jgi:Pentapeptide repeats (8 copies)
VLVEAPEPAGSALGGSEPSRLQADCGRCFGLCCVAPGFSASADFAIDKPAGRPCPNLRPDFGCGIHQHLRQQGFRGCAGYDCFGAGQWVSRITFGGRDWRRAPHTARQMFAVFAAMRQLHELLWYLSQALASRHARPLHGELQLALTATEGLTRSPAEALVKLDVQAHRSEVNDLLRRASELMRASIPGRKRNHAGADLMGARLKGAHLAGASLRGACLIGGPRPDRWCMRKPPRDRFLLKHQ